MQHLVSAVSLCCGLLYAGFAFAQSSGDDVTPKTGAYSNSGLMKPEHLNIDHGIHTAGAATRQSAGGNVDGSNKPSTQLNRSQPDPTNNALTASPKGPDTSGNDATK